VIKKGDEQFQAAAVVKTGRLQAGFRLVAKWIAKKLLERRETRRRINKNVNRCLLRRR
jgi:hypothetical protein